MTKKRSYKVLRIVVLLVVLTFSKAHAQTITDSTGKKIDSATKGDIAIDSVLNNHSPHKASIRSAIIPGWGQVYNKSYWKLPIIYGALGTTAYIFVYNLNAYKELRFAYSALYKASLPPYDPASTYPGPYQDSTDYYLLKPIYQKPETDINAVKFNRDEYRRYVDYSVLIFAVFWGLNVIDAAVDAHLKSFDVSPDLSLQFKAGYSDIARTNGFSVILKIK